MIEIRWVIRGAISSDVYSKLDKDIKKEVINEISEDILYYDTIFELCNTLCMAVIE